MHDNRGYVFILPLTPLSLRNFFSPPPPFQIQFYFVNPISLFLLIPPWRGAQNIYFPLPPSYTPHLPICNHMIFDEADRVRGRRREGRREKKGAGVGRGMKKCKNMEGREKRKIFARAAPGRRETRAGGVGPTLLSTL